MYYPGFLLDEVGIKYAKFRENTEYLTPAPRLRTYGLPLLGAHRSIPCERQIVYCAITLNLHLRRTLLTLP